LLLLTIGDLGLPMRETKLLLVSWAGDRISGNKSH
jgi:hypothetical protein